MRSALAAARYGRPASSAAVPASTSHIAAVCTHALPPSATRKRSSQATLTASVSTGPSRYAMRAGRGARQPGRDRFGGTDVREVTRQDAGCLGGQELPPGRRRPAWHGPQARRRPGSAGSSPRRLESPGRAVRPGFAGPPPRSAEPTAPPGRGSPPGPAGARTLRIGPLPPDQTPMPGQQGGRSDNPAQPQAGGQRPRQGGDYRAAGRVWFWAGDLPTQDRDLVPGHQDLRVLSAIAPRQEHQPAGHLDHEPVDKTGKRERGA
jgi:hypothetical protein